MTGNWHLAQLNIARPVAPLDSAVMADFVRDLPLINGIADAAPGFVWRLRDEDGADATSLRPYGPETMVNMCCGGSRRVPSPRWTRRGSAWSRWPARDQARMPSRFASRTRHLARSPAADR